ncbi:MAG: ammonium transporter [Desulfobacterales bacterium]|nr:ammonium transporter [Desulfobacterales bacterium]MDD4071009.1 ammonium transporter [Desulfobacterales bacterium]MDD4391922.1 ammonium transporter [Desulfobacterales bacterium]
MINAGDTSFMLISSALVMFMTPGLALFYGGMVRHKNILSTLVQSFICLGIVSIIWICYGYSMAFGPDIGSFIGNLDWAFLNGVSLSPGPYADSIPHLLFCCFQLMFAIITPALITGAFAERMKFSAFLLFTVLWTTLVYLPVCHWVWGGGWIGKMGALDFAGGTVIHINSGTAALVCALMIGKRKGWRKEPFMPHNLSLTVLGAGILWFGWFGFNAGSALSAGETASLAFMNTQLAAGSAAVSWIISEWILHGKPTTLGAASGAVAGLVAITPPAGFVGPVSSVIIGLLAGVICYLAISLKNRFNYDDALDVVAVHGIGGLWGALATGLFASAAMNPGGANGLFFGNPKLLGFQFIGALATILFSAVVTAIILKGIDLTVGLRITDEDEVQGLDLSQHSEVGFSL